MNLRLTITLVFSRSRPYAVNTSFVRSTMSEIFLISCCFGASRNVELLFTLDCYKTQSRKCLSCLAYHIDTYSCVKAANSSEVQGWNACQFSPRVLLLLI